MDKSEIKKNIEIKIKEIESLLPNLKKAAEPVAPDNAIGRLSRMEAIGAQAIKKRSYESAIIKVKNLKGALAQIDSDTFGICIECDEPIPPKRLLVMPESKSCVQCTELREKK